MVLQFPAVVTLPFRCGRCNCTVLRAAPPVRLSRRQSWLSSSSPQSPPTSPRGHSTSRRSRRHRGCPRGRHRGTNRPHRVAVATCIACRLVGTARTARLRRSTCTAWPFRTMAWHRRATKRHGQTTARPQAWARLWHRFRRHRLRLVSRAGRRSHRRRRLLLLLRRHHHRRRRRRRRREGEMAVQRRLK